jgi:uncharacterized caspase-like protein
MIRTRDSVDVFVFYSGHGAPENGQRFLVPVDGDFDRLANTGFSLDRLYRNLSAIKARSVTVVLDACFSGNSEGGRLFRRSGGGGVEGEQDANGLLSFTAVQKTETARWYPEQGHGLFTYYFLKGVKGEADANGDRVITQSELSTYVHQNVLRYATEKLSSKQEPIITLTDGNRVVVRLGPVGGK